MIMIGIVLVNLLLPGADFGNYTDWDWKDIHQNVPIFMHIRNQVILMGNGLGSLCKDPLVVRLFSLNYKFLCISLFNQYTGIHTTFYHSKLTDGRSTIINHHIDPL